MDDRQTFSQRLNELCDEAGIPPKGQNRQARLAEIFNVSQKGARKWLEGEGYPSTENLIRIATWANVSFEWLVTGRGPKRVWAESARPNISALLKIAQSLPDYKVNQLIKIGAAIAEPEPDGDSPDEAHGHAANGTSTA